jgi:Outer membrane protein beta-barrel domain
MKKIAFIFILLTILTKPAVAQTGFGPEVGVNMANLTTKFGGNAPVNTMAAGLKAGFLIDFHLSGRFSVQTGPYISMKGCTSEIADANNYKSSYTLSFNYLEVPINLIYKHGKPGHNHIFVGGGAYYGYLLHASRGDVDYHIGSDKALDQFTSTDFGVNGMLGFEHKKGFLIRANYSYGLANVVTGGDADNSATHTVIGVTVGWLFHSKGDGVWGNRFW